MVFLSRVRNPEAFAANRRNRLDRLKAKHKECVRLAALKAAAKARDAPVEAQGESIVPSIEPEPVSWKGTPLPNLRRSPVKKRPFERAGAPSPEPLADAPTQTLQGAYCVTVPEVSPVPLDFSHLPRIQIPEGDDVSPSPDEDWYDWSMFRPDFSFRPRTPAPTTRAPRTPAPRTPGPTTPAPRSRKWAWEV